MAYRCVIAPFCSSVTNFLGGIASFQAIMHVLSELRNPLFDAPDRQRALRALQTSSMLRENNTAKAWQAVRNMIDRVVAEHNASSQSRSQTSSAYASPSVPLSTSIQVEHPSNSNTQMYPTVEAMSSYPFRTTAEPYNQQGLPAQSQPIHSQPTLLQPMHSMQSQAPPCWDDINLNNINNIVGDVQPVPGVLPDFDFVSNVEVD